MRKIEKLIPFAVEAISKSKIADSAGIVEKAFKGYIASLGAGLVLIGILPTLAMYSEAQGNNNKKGDTGKILDALFIIIKDIHKSESINEADLFHYSLAKMDNTEYREIFTNELLNAVIALKLALRTFKFSDK
jgi:hypothetical protein